MSTSITKRLRQIRNAWQFQFKLGFVFTAQWFRLGGDVAHYLTRRYISGEPSMDKEKLEYKILCASFFMALVSFIYSSVDFYSQYNEKYELSIVSSKTKSGSNDNEFRSEFVLSNAGNRTLLF